MGQWKSNFPSWGPAWAAVRGLCSTADGDAVLMSPPGGGTAPQYVATWPGQDTTRVAGDAAARRGARLTLVTEDATEATGFAVSQGLTALSRLALLTGDPADLAQTPQLPEGAEISLARLPDATAVEISAFGETVALGRLAVGAGCAVFGGLDIRRPDPDHTMESAILAALSYQSSVLDIPVVLTPVLPKSALWYRGQGWSPAADILTFMRTRDA